MFIQTAQTPNPLTLKFLPGQVVMEEGTAFMEKGDDVSHCPLASHLLGIEQVQAVFLGMDFISVTKNSDVSWNSLRPFILAILMDHFLTNQPLFTETVTLSTEKQETPLEQEIRELLEKRVRPAVARDGGDIVFDHFEDGVVYVSLRGACSGCPSASATLKAGIENMLRHYIPEVEEVRAL